MLAYNVEVQSRKGSLLSLLSGGNVVQGSENDHRSSISDVRCRPNPPKWVPLSKSVLLSPSSLKGRAG